MAESVAERGRARQPDPFDELRSLLVGPEQRELVELHSQLHDTSLRTEAVASVLPDAFALAAHDRKLSGAIAPMVEDAITASVRRNPQPLADALFPVIGPAIRKAIHHALASMMESFNRSVEHSVSWRALRWRWTAWRTGRPFAEIVLLETLEYRVEQVFLIHAESGLVLQHVSRGAATGQDPDQVSAMLTAIRDFARDSFDVEGRDSVDALRIADLDVLVEQGPHAVLAAVVRGTPPPSLRPALQDGLESIHRRLRPALVEFAGDASPFEQTRPLLEACLVSRERARPRTTTMRPALVAAVLVLIALSGWAYLRWRETGRWNAYLERLSAEPGIAVLSSGRRGGRFFVVGLRDPLARDPDALVAGTALAPAAFDRRWESFQALHPPFVTARAAALLKPPPGVTLAFQNGTLTAAGEASEQWVAESDRLAPAIAGVRDFRYEGPALTTRLRERLEATTVLFAVGMSTISPDQEAVVREIARLLAELDQALAGEGRRAAVEVLGFTDADGPDALNVSLSQARADRILTALDAGRFRALELSAAGRGRPESAGEPQNETAKQQWRRVSLRVEFAGAAGSDRR